MVFSYGVAAINQGLHSSLGTGLIFTFSTLASMLFSILLLEKNFGLYALAIALFAKGFLLLTFNLLYLLIRMRFDNIQFSLSIRSLKNISTLSMYTFWGKLVSGFAVNFEPLLISYFLGPLAVTNYSITKKSSELGLSFLERPSIAIIPSLSSIYAEKKNSRTIEIVITMLKCVLWASGLAFSGVVVVNYIFVSFWVGSQFYAGENINLALSLSAVATLLANSMANTCYALGNIKQNSIVLLIQNISSILLAYWGFIFWGTLGVALAPAISVLVFPLWYYIHTLSIKLNFSRKVLLGLVVEATYAICASVITCLSAFAFLPKSNPFLLPLAIAYCLTLYLFLLFSFSRQFRSMIFLGFSRFRNSGNIIT
jgi:O-antigen/teichoic acid export membrane protein